MQTRVKQEQVNQVFIPNPDSLPGMEVETDGFPAPGERDDLEVALEAEMEHHQ